MQKILKRASNMWFPLLLFGVLWVAHAQQCPDLYKRYSSEHTFCKPPNTACTILKRGVSAKDKELILKLHNDYRSRVATGKETLAGGLPQAANMLQMVWDDDLAAVAQKLAETCNYGHDCNNCRKVKAFSVGQNIGQSYGFSNAPDSADWRSFIKGLYDEVSRFNKNWIKPFRPSPGGDKTYGHFTQVTWATSWKIGCGWTVYNDGGTLRSYTVCNYGPGGNMKNGEMYKAGPSGSACPKNTGVSADYPGLCKVKDTNSSPEGPGPQSNDYIFYCDFNDQKDCAKANEGKAWSVVKTAGGSWLSVVLNGGEKTKLIFDRSFQTTGAFCLKLVVRKGPNVDGEADMGEGGSYLDAGFFKPKYDLKFTGVPKSLRQNFMPQLYGLNASGAKIQFSFEYSVPAGAPPQFIEIEEISAKDGDCVI